MTSAGGRWDLTSEALDRLLERLDPDREAAAVEYEGIRQMLLDFFGWRGSQNPSEQADETLDRVARRLQGGEQIDHVRRYVHGVARRVFSESTRRRERERGALAELAVVGRPEPTRWSEERSGCLEQCITRLSPDERGLLSEYYAGHGRPEPHTRRALAERLGITYGALRVRALRARGQLEVCLTRCLDGKTREDA